MATAAKGAVAAGGVAVAEGAAAGGRVAAEGAGAAAAAQISLLRTAAQASQWVARQIVKHEAA